jgi:hypothetical protein
LIGYRDQASLAAQPRHQAEAPSGPALGPSLSDGNGNQG